MSLIVSKINSMDTLLNPTIERQFASESSKLTNLALNALNFSWEKEYNKYSHYIKENQTNFKSSVEQLNQIICQIYFEDFEIELTPNNSVKYTLLLPDKKLLMITKSFNSYEDKGEKDVVFSIFDNRTHIISDIKNLDELVEGINRYLDM